MAVELAVPQPLGKGWPVRPSAGSASACSAATDARSGQPARTPTPAGAATDRADLGRFRGAMPIVERPRTVALARPTAVASDREPRASSTAYAEVGAAVVGRSHPGGRRSVIGVEHFPAPGRGGDVALSPTPPSSFDREHERRASRRASPLRPGLGCFAAARGRRATPGRLRTPGQVAWALATFARALERAKVAVLSPGVGASTPEWGQFRTLNWTLNAPNASGERPHSGHKTRRLTGKTGKWRGPESNRGHHDFQAVATGALRRQNPHSNAVQAGAGARRVPEDAGRCA
jgi:hypothetical protein